METKFSVLMSVYEKDRADWLKESIDSVLSSTVKADEFLVVCDGPINDEVSALLSEYGESISLHQFPKNRGLGPTLNDGIKLCRNELIARMDSDDISCPERFEKQLDLLIKDDCALVGTYVDEFLNSTDNIIAIREVPITEKEIRAFAKKRNPFNHPSVMFKKSSVIKAGGYQDMPLFEDYWLWIRMLENNERCANVPEVLLHMRSGDELYRRRGGASYAKKIWKFKKAVYKSGYVSYGEFIASALPHVIVSLMPNFLREAVYKKMLRK